MEKKTVTETNLEARIEVAIEQIRQLRSDVTEIKIKLDSNYVTKDEFDPYKKGLLAVSGAVALAIINSILELIKLR